MKSSIRNIWMCLAAALLFGACEHSDDVERAPLSIESIAPVSGGPGTELIVNGTGFPLDLAQIAVAINGIACPVEACNEEQILAIIPENRLIGSAPVEVTVDGVTLRSPMNFTYFDGKMFIDAVSPLSGGPGTEITIAGGNFPEDGYGVVVSVNGVEFPVVSADAETIVARVPNDPRIATGAVRVAVGNVVTESEEEFTFVQPDVEILSISPEQGVAGTRVKIAGCNFTSSVEALRATLNDVVLEIAAASETEIEVVIPKNDEMGSGRIVVEFGSKRAESPREFVYIVTRLSISSVEPLQATQLTEYISVKGTFPADIEGIKVWAGEAELTVERATESELRLANPKSKLASGPIVIELGGERAVSERSFSYLVTGVVTTLAGTGEAGFRNGPGAEATFRLTDPSEPWKKGAICVDDDCNVYVWDIFNRCIRKIAPDGEVSTFVTDIDTGVYGMDCDAEGNLWTVNVVTWQIYKITPQGEQIWVCGTPKEPRYLAVDRYHPGVVYIASMPDDPTYGGLCRYDSNTGQWSSFAEGTKYSAIAAAPDGSVYACNESGAHWIERFVPTGDGWVGSTFAGNGWGFGDGALRQSNFANPRGLAIDPRTGDLCVAGNGRNDDVSSVNADQAVRRVILAEGQVVTMAGNGDAGGTAACGFRDGVGSEALFHGAQDIAVDKNGVIYIYDKMNHAVRKLIWE